MPTLTDAANRFPSPDDICMVCGDTLENHGDRQHMFSRDGSLKPLNEAPKPRQEAPKERRASLPTTPQPPSFTGADKGHQLTLRLVTLLVKRNILDGADLMYLFSEGDPDAVPERPTSA